MSVMDTMLMLAEPEIGAMAERVNEFPTPEAALISAIGLNPQARNELDSMMERAWSARWTPPTKAIPEVVIGSGPHALIYAAVRASKGIKVVVLERNRRAGGAFGCSRGPAFWLNSRNRPGPLGLPGEGLGLNVLPGCMVQPSMIGGGEYMTNDQLGWVIRVNLMMLGVEVHTGVEVTDISFDASVSDGDGFFLNIQTRTPDSGGILTRTGQVRARRVVVATGLGDPTLFTNPNFGAPRSNRLLSFAEFMAKMDTPFPLRGMNRVAVIGAGDSGKTVVEALLGIGPSSGMSVAALDFPQQIDWYGCPATTNAQWCDQTQGRYARIGKALGNRITVRAKALFYPTAGYESVQMGPRSYDWVVSCTGSAPNSRLIQSFDFMDENLDTGRRVARTGSLDETPVPIHLIGPATGLALTERETEAVPALARVKGNSVSMFRWAPLTAAFATLLPPVGA